MPYDSRTCKNNQLLKSVFFRPKKTDLQRIVFLVFKRSKAGEADDIAAGLD